MKYSSKRSSSLFLIELMITIFFFTVGAACCTKIFARAWRTSQDAKNLDQAQGMAENMATVLDAIDDPDEELSDYFPHIVMEAGSYKVFYNKSWEECPPEDGHYTMETTLSVEGSRWTAYIVIKDKEQRELYQLETVRHIPLTAWEKRVGNVS